MTRRRCKPRATTSRPSWASTWKVTTGPATWMIRALQVTSNPFRHRGQVLDLDELADAPLVVGQAGGQGVSGGIFQMGHQRRGREDGGHPIVGEDHGVARPGR